MKKTMIGLMAMAATLVTGQQSSASSLLDAMIAAPLGPISFKYSGYTQTLGGMTQGIFELITWHDGAPPTAGNASWAAGASFGNTYGYAVVSGFDDEYATANQIGSSGGTWQIYANNSFIDIATGWSTNIGDVQGGTLLLSGDFATQFVYQNSENITLVQSWTQNQATGIFSGDGNAYGNITGGIPGLISKFDSDSQNFDSDFWFNFNYSTITGPWLVGEPALNNNAAKVNDPVTGAAVPEPATMLLFGSGLVGLAGLRRRRSK